MSLADLRLLRLRADIAVPVNAPHSFSVKIECSVHRAHVEINLWSQFAFHHFNCEP